MLGFVEGANEILLKIFLAKSWKQHPLLKLFEVILKKLKIIGIFYLNYLAYLAKFQNYKYCNFWFQNFINLFTKLTSSNGKYI